MTTTQTPTANLDRHFHGHDSLRNCGKAIAKALGFTGRPGGWIYTTTGRPYCQGYDVLARQWGAKYVNHLDAPDGKAYHYLTADTIAQIERHVAADADRQARREAADAKAAAKLAELREREPVVPTHAVVDTLHGHTFTAGGDGVLFTAETAAAFAAHRDSALKPGIPGHIVVALVPVTR